jgi:hypothetical protein
MKPRQPGPDAWELRLKINGIAQKLRHNAEPRQERLIDEDIPPAHQILMPGKNAIQHAGHATDLVEIALARTGEGLWVVDREPNSLAEVRALAAHLVVQPLLGLKVLRGPCRKAECVDFVVFFDEVFEYRAGLPEGYPRVGGLYCRDAAIGVD